MAVRLWGRQCPLWLGSKAISGLMFGGALNAQFPTYGTGKRPGSPRPSCTAYLLQAPLRPSVPQFPPVLAFSVSWVLSPHQRRVSSSALDDSHQGVRQGLNCPPVSVATTSKLLM